MGRPKKVKPSSHENILENEPEPLLALSFINDQILNNQINDELQKQLELSRSNIQQSVVQEQEFDIDPSYNELLQQQYKKIKLNSKIQNQIVKIKGRIDEKIIQLDNKPITPDQKSWKQIFCLNHQNQLELQEQMQLKAQIDTLYIQYTSKFKLNIYYDQNTIENVMKCLQSLLILRNTLLLLPNQQLIQQNLDIIIKCIQQLKQLITFISIQATKTYGPIKQIDTIIKQLSEQFNIQMEIITNKVKKEEFRDNLITFINMSKEFINHVGVNQQHQQQLNFCQKLINIL